MLEMGCAWSKGSGERLQGHHGPLVSLNIFFSEITYRILMKFHRNVPVMLLFRIS